LLLGRAAEAAKQFDTHGKSREALLESFEVLEGEDGGWREQGDLLVVIDDFEGGAHGHFRFAVADITAEEAIHRLALLHVLLDVGDGGDLIGRFFEFERVFEFALKISVRRKRKAGSGLALRVKGKKLLGHVFERLADARFACVPAGAAEFVERRVRAFENAIALHQIHALQGNVEPRILGVAQKHEFAAMAIGFNLAKAFELADAVIHMHDKVTGLELGKIAEKTGSTDFVAGPLLGGGDVEEIGVAVNREIRFGKRDAFGEGRANQKHAGGFLRTFGGKTGSSLFRFAENVRHFVFAADIGKALDLAGAGGGEKHATTGSQL